MVSMKIKIRAALLYEFKLKHKATQAARNIRKAFGDDSLSDRTAQFWFAKFDSGEETLEDDPRSGRPEVIDDNELQNLIESDSRQTCQEMAVCLGTSESTVRNHLHAIGKVRKLDKWVPHNLSAKDKLQRLTICSSLIQRHNREPLLDRIIACDEKWVLYNNTTRSYQWLAPDESPKKLAKPSLHPKKILIIVFWTAVGKVHYELLRPGQTITAELYSQILERVHKKLLQLQPALVNRRGPLLLHDNASPHRAKITRLKILKLSWEILPHPAYSPDISPTDYHLFRSLSNHMKKKIFKNPEALDTELQSFFCF